MDKKAKKRLTGIDKNSIVGELRDEAAALALDAAAEILREQIADSEAKLKVAQAEAYGPVEPGAMVLRGSSATNSTRLGSL